MTYLHDNNSKIIEYRQAIQNAIRDRNVEVEEYKILFGILVRSVKSHLDGLELMSNWKIIIKHTDNQINVDVLYTHPVYSKTKAIELFSIETETLSNRSLKWCLRTPEGTPFLPDQLKSFEARYTNIKHVIDYLPSVVIETVSKVDLKLIKEIFDWHVILDQPLQRDNRFAHKSQPNSLFNRILDRI